MKPTWLHFGRVLGAKLEPSWLQKSIQKISKKIITFWISFGLRRPRGSNEPGFGALVGSWSHLGAKMASRALQEEAVSVKIIENLWFLSGDLHIGLLKKHGCKFWDHWADEEGYVPSAYGNFWRKFPIHGSDEYNDQVKYVLSTLNTNPNSRRMVISAWAPGNAQKSGLPPCHLLFIFNVQYDKDKGIIKSIPMLQFNTTTRKFTLKRNEKRTSTVKHLTQTTKTKKGIKTSKKDTKKDIKKDIKKLEILI